MEENLKKFFFGLKIFFARETNARKSINGKIENTKVALEGAVGVDRDELLKKIEGLIHDGEKIDTE